VRAKQTAAIICDQGALAGGPARTIIDERLREREFGIFDRLTTSGIRHRFPEEAAHRRRLGKFYHRPPGGESWADVILRLRSILNTINIQHCDKRVLIVCHQVVVLCFRYILEELDEAEILGIDKQSEVLNCGIAAYDFTPDPKDACVPELSLWNYSAPLEAEGASKTSEPDAMAGTR
jgi:broad specificity phosphatase PhoE